MTDKPSGFATGSAPDIVQRLRHAIEANETTRIVLYDNLKSLASALDDHLSQIDAHLLTVIADIERRERH